MIQLSKPLIGQDEIDAVTEVIKSGNIAEGQKVKDFEKAFAEYIGTKYAVAVNSGTAALQISLLANNIGMGDEVITTPFSFIATSNSILYTGARPVFADINKKTFNIDPESVEKKITPNTKAIIPVHLYGQPSDIKILMEIAKDNNLLIIEDACQAHGAEFNGKKVGSFGIGCFSFYPTKNMTTGEGGMITTNDVSIANIAKIIRSHGSRKRYFHEILGYNMRMTDIAAAIGLVQLKKLDNFNKFRIRNAKYFNDELSNIKGITVPHIDKQCKHVFNQYTLKIDNDIMSRDNVSKFLNEKGVGTGIYYPIPIHKQPCYNYTCKHPISEKLSNEVLSIPVNPSLSLDELNIIMETLKDAALNKGV